METKTPIRAAEITGRLRKRLLAGGYSYMEDALATMRVRPEALMGIPFFGRKCMAELRSWSAKQVETANEVALFPQRLEAALHCAQFTADELRGALAAANAMESLVIMPMIASAATLVTSLQAALAAVRSPE